MRYASIRISRTCLCLSLCVLFSWSIAWAKVEQATQIDGPVAISGDRNFLAGYPPINDDGTVNAVIEIPAGTTAKWETSKNGQQIKWEIKKGKRRIVKYLAYPGNYGMIPQSLLPKEQGGDGDPLDVIVLGQVIPRGTIAKVRLIGVLKLLDDGEQDDKLIAVVPGTDMGNVKSIAQLTSDYPGVTLIIETWFLNYKGPGEMQSSGFEGREKANKILNFAAKAYKDHQ